MNRISVAYAALQSPNRVVIYTSGLQNKEKFEQPTSICNVLYTS